MAPMMKERCRFPLAVFGSKFLFAIGGCSEHGESSSEEEEDGHAVHDHGVNMGYCERYKKIHVCMNFSRHISLIQI